MQQLRRLSGVTVSPHAIPIRISRAPSTAARLSYRPCGPGLYPLMGKRAQTSKHSRCKSSTDTEQKESSQSVSFSPEVLGSIAVVMGLGVSNRVLYKMALTPLSDYVFFLAQFQTFSYVLVYFAVLGYKRYWSRTVSQEQLEATNKKIFLYIGAAEAVSQVLGFIGASKLPGVVIPLVSQSVLLWQIAVGRLVLGKKLPAIQIGGAMLVLFGVCVAAWPSQDGASTFSDVDLKYALIYAFSMLFPALSAIFKERIFEDAKQKLDGERLDLFAVNSFGSAAQALFVFLLLPVLSSLRGIPLSELPQYLSEGFSCMSGRLEGCEAAPALAALYVSCNLGFNIALLNLLRAAGNVVQSLTLSFIVPLTIAAFTLELPFLSAAPPLEANFVIGSSIMFLGLLTFNAQKYAPALRERFGKED